MKDLVTSVTATLDWVAGTIAARLGAADRPARLARPTVFVGLAAGLTGDAVASTAGSPATTLVSVALTVCGFGALDTVVAWLGRGDGSGGTRSAGSALLEEWLRRLQVVLAAVLLVAVGFMVVGGVTASAWLTIRYVAESMRIATVLLAISFALVSDQGLPQWLVRLVGRPATSRGD